MAELQGSLKSQKSGINIDHGDYGGAAGVAEVPEVWPKYRSLGTQTFYEQTTGQYIYTNMNGFKEISSKSSRTMKPAILDEPPDGGWGWMVVIATFIVLFLVRGIQFTSAIFFDILIEYFQEGAGPISAALCKRYSHRQIVFIGGLLTSVSMVISTFAPTVEFVTITFGVLAGVGFSLARIPAVGMLGRYFNKRHATAMGIASIGSGCGGFVMAPFGRLLINFYGWRGSILILGGLVLNICVSAVLLRPIHITADDKNKKMSQELMTFESNSAMELSPRNRVSQCCINLPRSIYNHFELSLFKIHMFSILMVCYALHAFGFNIPLVHVIKRAINIGISDNKAPALLSVLGFCMMVAGFAQGLLVDVFHLSKGKVFGAAITIYGISTTLLTTTKDFTSMSIVMAIMGLSRGVISTFDSVVVRDIVGHHKFTSAYGLSVLFLGISQLVGPPIAGYIYDYTHDYEVSFYVAGATLILSGLMLIVSFFFWDRKKVRKRKGNDVTHEGNDVTHEGNDVVHDGNDVALELNDVTPEFSDEEIVGIK
ncbi:monocarboxylate transporter 12-like [Glandiceps talaboti]